MNIKSPKVKIVLGICLALLILLIGTSLFFLATLPDPANLTQRQMSESTQIYDRTGKILLYEIFKEENRTVITWDQIPKSVKDTTLAAEDARFYQHAAVDFKGILRAIRNNFLDSTTLQGASTITQQLAKNAFLTKEKSVIRKIKELFLSLRLEKIYTKDQILELYLNQVPYGSNAYGIESASHLYFNKAAKDLSVSEAAYLAALLQSPSYLSPYGSHRKELDDRQAWVLSRLETLKWLSPEEVANAKKEKVKFMPPGTDLQAPHFVMYIKEQLAQKFGSEEIDSLGLKVITTLDMRLQKIAEDTVTKYGESNAKNLKAGNMALLSQDPKTGQILAMVGSKDYFDIENEGNFNVTLATRQPGSSFKPFAYVTAFQKGYTDNTVLFDLPTNFSNNINQPYAPQNYDSKFRGPVTLRSALAQSLNIPSVKVLYLAGIADTINTAKSMGITSLKEKPDYYGLSLVLGGGGVKLIDMVNAYSVFARDGVKHEQVSILRIEDAKGKVLEEYKPKETKVLEPQYARMINNILSDNEARTPMFNINNSLHLVGYQAAAKTGTSQDYRDAWILGYTPTLTTGVWVGNNDYSPIEKGGAGASASAPCWNEFMSAALKIIGTEDFNPPASVESNKPMMDGNYIVIKNFKIDRLTGELANVNTPLENITETYYKQIHSILYYTNKSDPLGPPLKDPNQDSQFLNWEMPVLIWAQNNVPNFTSEYNQPIPTNYLKEEPIFVPPSSPVDINIMEPLNGDTISDNFILKVAISDLERINPDIIVFLNGSLIGKMSRTNSQYLLPITFSQLADQNEIKIEAQKEGQNIGQSQIIVFKKTDLPTN